MWGIVLVLVALAGAALAIVDLYRRAAAMRQAGYAMFSRLPLSELPRPVRRTLLRTILRGEPVPPELLPNARNWANYMALSAGWRMTYVWLAVTLAALLLNIVTSGDPLTNLTFWPLVGCAVVLAVSGMLASQYRRAAQRLLRET
ncbi:hypothetical protein [Kutzneria sp. NPDC052558]|uniref:hypothetical protein n=1 Tax=Kutzneria sp. NPDC052558 TaxID=3364121 RepID=UPI0037CAEB96